MALTLGTNTYLELADFKAWADLRAKNYSSYTDSQIEAALVVASIDFIDANYNFKGQKVDDLQQMKLPTDLVAIADISNAAAQTTWQALNNELFISPTANSSGQITSQSDTLDVLSTSVSFAENSAAYYKHDTTQIDRLIKPFTVGSIGGNMARVRLC